MKQKDDASVPASQLTAVMNYMHKHVISQTRTHARTHTNTCCRKSRPCVGRPTTVMPGSSTESEILVWLVDHT